MFRKQEIIKTNSCLNKAHDDELIFVLLERDESSIAAVGAWIRHRIDSGKNTPDDPQIIEAIAWVNAATITHKFDQPRIARFKQTPRR